jgi:hypothetical protein
MKKITFLFLFFAAVGFSQTKGISYQALILDPIEQQVPGFNNDKAPLANKNICLQFSVIDENTDDEYVETHIITTDEFGMVNLTIGLGIITGGYATTFEGILWSTLPKNLKVAISMNGSCTDFTEISNAPFTAVPFALFAVNTINTTNANLTGMVTSVGNATTVVTNADLTGMVTSSGNATSLGSFTSANLSGAVTDETGTGSAVFATSPTLVTPALGTPSALVGTNITGTASGLTAGNVTTNANLTGDVTSSGNATTIAASSITNAQLAGSIDLTSKVSGVLPIANGGTASTSAPMVSVITAANALAARTNLGFISGSGTILASTTSLTISSLTGVTSSSKVIVSITSGGETSIGGFVPIKAVANSSSITVSFVNGDNARAGVPCSFNYIIIL